MSELDAFDPFERRFAAAYRRYLDEVPTAVDAVGVARVVAVAPRARRVALPWTPRPLPALAWLVLLGLLLAVLGASLIVGSRHLQRVPAVVPPVGQVYECPPGSTPDEPGPVDQARPAEEWSATAFDRRAGRLVVVTNAANGVETWTFDICTNTWARMHPNQEPPGFEYAARLVYDVDSDVTIAWFVVSYGERRALLDPQTGTWTWSGGEGPAEMWAYDLQADTWTEKKAPPTSEAVFLAYDPVSGLVVAAPYSDPGLMWTYDVETDRWTPIHWANPGPSQGVVIAYDVSVDRLVAYGDAAYGSPPYETWLFDLRSGTWSRSAAERPAVVGWLTAPGLVYDEAAERTLIFDRDPFTAYDASADRWEILAAPYTPWDEAPSEYAYDAVNRRLVGWRSGGNVQQGSVVALDLTTREWTVLLAAFPKAAAKD